MDWRHLTTPLQALIPSPWVQIVLALVAVVCGSIVGAEREKREKPAGLRTLILVCLGSTVFTLASFAFTSTTGDSGRVAAQIVTGIGFLGAGAILHSAGMVRGMTTAATIWATAATGMVVGTGHAAAGLGLSVLVRLVLSSTRALERRAWGGVQPFSVELGFQPEGGRTQARIEKIMEDHQLLGGLEIVGTGDAARGQGRIHGRLSRRHRREFLNDLAQVPGVESIREAPR